MMISTLMLCFVRNEILISMSCFHRRTGVLESLICLHSLGLWHGDAEERNIARDREDKTFKFIDFCSSTWHDCPGAAVCEETCLARRATFGPDSNKPLALLEEDVVKQWGTHVSKKYVDKDTSKKVRKASEPFLKVRLGRLLCAMTVLLMFLVSGWRKRMMTTMTKTTNLGCWSAA